ncbi:MAG: polysaccharide deacetylase family protein [Candidatus Margulisiibacteriota bacterium]
MKKILILILLMMATKLQAAGSEVQVLCYHTFLGKPKIYTDFSVQEFKQHLDLLKQKQFKFVSWPQMVAGQVTGTRNILIVIDDGNRSAFSAYEQVLKPAGIQAVFAVYPGIINRVRFALTWDQVLALQAGGQTLVSHGYFHEYLTDAFKEKFPQRFDDEVLRSKRELEAHGVKPVTVYVYPFGVVSDSGKAALKEAGYRYGFSLAAGKVRLPLSKNADAFDLPRVMMTRSIANGFLNGLK